jgi:YVTN family beta-propeller protein
MKFSEVHGLGFSFDHKTLAIVSIGSNSVTFLDTATNDIKHTTYVGRPPHEPFFTPDGSELWVTVRGEDYVSVIDSATYEGKIPIQVGNGPGMTILRPDGKNGFVCSSFTPETKIIDVKTHQSSRLCPKRHLFRLTLPRETIQDPKTMGLQLKQHALCCDCK